MRLAWNATTIEYIGAGFNNAHHLVRTRDQAVVLRRALAPIDALRRRLDREYAVLQFLADHNYLHAPKAVRQIPEGELDACAGYAMTFVDGDGWNGTAAEAHALGEAAAALHRLPVDELPHSCGQPLDPMAIVGRLTTRLRGNLRMVGAQMTDGQRRRAEQLLDTLPGKLGAMDWTGSRSVLVHGDLGDHNVRFINGRAVLLDWEFAALADPLFDLMWFAARDGAWERHMTSFLDGYADDAMRSRLQHLKSLRALALVELALWAQSGLDDISEGRNQHFFRPDDGNFLERQVERLEEAAI